MSGNPDESYDVSCETTRLACDTNPGDLCDVMISSANPSSTRRALSFEEAFDGDLDAQKVSNHRRLDWQNKLKSAVNSQIQKTPWFRGGFGAEPQRFVKVGGNGFCIDATGRDGTARRFLGANSLSAVRQTCSSDSNCIGIAYSPQQSVLYTSTGCQADCSNTAWLKNRKLIVSTWNYWHAGSSCWVKADLGNWMHWFGIQDDTLVASMWIPGTHDTMALHGDVKTILGDVSDPFGYAKTQDLSLRDQLDAGIRAIDIRVKFDGCGAHSMRIFHGSFYQKTNWLEVKQTLEDWITTHPTEFVLVFVQNENPVKTWTCHGKAMHLYLLSELDASKWYTDWGEGFENPRYGNYRGRLVYLEKRHSTRFNNNAPQIQDNWEYVTREQKWDAVVNHEAQVRQSVKLYINMLSAAPTLGYEFSTPAEFALFINERVYQNIDTFKFGSELPQIEPSPSSQLSHEASARLA